MGAARSPAARISAAARFLIAFISFSLHPISAYRYGLRISVFTVRHQGEIRGHENRPSAAVFPRASNRWRAIDSELRLLAAVRWSIREHGGEPSSCQIDELLDERLAHSQFLAGVGDRGAVGKHKSSSAPTRVRPRCFLKLSVSESQLSRADYPRPTGRKVP